MTEELDVQKECQKELVALVNRLRQVVTDQANDIKNREPNVTERSLILSSSVSKLNELARRVLALLRWSVSPPSCRADSRINAMQRSLI